MTLSSLSIKKRALIGIFSVIIVILCLIGWKCLSNRDFALSEPPVISVVTFYPGASSDVIASKITKPIAESFAEANALTTISSESRKQISIISVIFNRDIKSEDALKYVRDKVAQSKNQIPSEVDPPIVEIASSPENLVAFLEVESDTKDSKEVKHLASTVIKDRMQSIPGIHRVAIVDAHRFEMRLRVDPIKLAEVKLTTNAIRQALLRENVDLPSGGIEGNSTILSVRSTSRLKSVEDINNMIIKQTENAIIRLKDVGFADLLEINERKAYSNGTDHANRIGVGVALQIQKGANAIEVVDECYKRLEQLRREVPKGFRLTNGYDFTKSVRASIREVEKTLIVALGFVALLMVLFLRDWRSTIIPELAIPVSLLSAFFIMYVAGFSTNVLTLVGLVLAIGLVVDGHRSS